jgi:soluble lytic murein transglycosylase-like protein
MTVRRGALGAVAALVIAVSGLASAPASAATPALSPWDAQLYSAAFDAARRGDFKTAADKVALVRDRCLVGMVEYQKLFHPTAYKATYEELVDWLSKYGDLPVADKVWALAVKRKPEGAPDPVRPSGSAQGRTWESVAVAATIDPSAATADPYGPKAAREALNAGDLHLALKLADANGDRWTGGLAAYRLKQYDQAFNRFQQVALDVAEDGWVRSGAGYWAARSAIAKGSPELAPQFLQVAAQFPRTFYGQIAERQLGLEPAVRRGPVPYVQARSPIVKASTANSLDTPSIKRFLAAEPRAKRALALAQLGQRVDAALELRSGFTSAIDDQSRQDWTELALAINGMFAGGREQDIVDEKDYPIPDLQPNGGFTVDRALVYALIRQESRFDPSAKSYAGAYGLMQVMPSTAAWLEGDDKLRREPDRLLDPAVNLRVGQDYIAYLMGQAPINGDLLRMAASYNGGPAPVFGTHKQMPDADILLFIESIPVPQARDYVEKVVANYWIYKHLLGEATPTLDAVAGGARTVKLVLDYVPPPPAPVAPPAPVVVTAVAGSASSTGTR